MAGNVQDAARGVVRHGNGHAAFAGDEADIADRRVPEIARIMVQIGADAAARPVTQQALL